MYTSKVEFTKDPKLYGKLGFPNSMVTMVDSQRHKIYRDALTPLFSKRRIEELGILLSKILEKGSGIITRRYQEGRHVNIQLMYRCITVCSRDPKEELRSGRDVLTRSQTDLIEKITTGRMQNVMRYMEGPQDEMPPVLSSIDEFTKGVHLMTHFPILQRLALKLPPSLGKMIAPGYIGFRSVSEPLDSSWGFHCERKTSC